MRRSKGCDDEVCLPFGFDEFVGVLIVHLDDFVIDEVGVSHTAFIT